MDSVCEPFMAGQIPGSFLTALFGSGKGSGAALVMFILGVSGAVLCLVSGRKLTRYRYREPLEQKEERL